LPDANLVGLYFVIILGICFITYTIIKYKNTPELNDIVIIILSCVGIIVGLDLGYFILATDEKILGLLSKYRLPIALGSLSIVWTSIDSIKKTWSLSIKNIKQSLNKETDSALNTL